MKLIIQDNRIAATATDEYSGPDTFMDAPEDFDPARMGDYRLINEVLVIPPPQSVTMRQARLALLDAGLLDEVEAAFAQAGVAARIEWEYAQEVRRDSPLVAQMGQVLSLDDADLDALFAQAVQL